MFYLQLRGAQVEGQQRGRDGAGRSAGAAPQLAQLQTEAKEAARKSVF